MRIAHLADLHLGKVFHGLSLLEDQRHALDQVIETLQRERVEVLLLAGDLYDRALPGSEAVRLLDGFLREVNETCRVPVIAIAGNHDSADHLGFGSWLFSRGDLHVRGRIEESAVPITLEDAHGEVTFYPVPYVEPESARAVLGPTLGEDEDLSTHCAAVRAMLSIARAHQREHGVRRAVVIAHAFVTGERWPEESRRSERSLYLGGVGAVPAAEFKGFQYAALGHLHRPQSLDAEGRVRYPGSLLKYSFDEVAHDKGMTLVDLGPDGEIATRHVSIRPRRDLARLSGRLEDLLRDPALAPHEGSLVSAEITDLPPPLQAMEKLRQRFPHAAELTFKRLDVRPDLLRPLASAAQRDPEEVFTEFFARHASVAPTEAEREVFREALAQARAEGEGA